MIASKRMTASAKRFSQTPNCVSVCMPKKTWIKSGLFIWWRHTKTPPPPDTQLPFQLSKTAQKALLHSQRQVTVAPCGPAVSDAQKPSMTLVFLSLKTRRDCPALLLLCTCCFVFIAFYVGHFHRHTCQWGSIDYFWADLTTSDFLPHLLCNKCNIFSRNMFFRILGK